MNRRTPKTIILLTVFIDLLGFGIIIPILPVVSAQFLPEAWQGRGAALLMVVFSLFQMLFSPLWGRLSDRFGRRPILLISLLGSTISYLIFAVSRNFEMLLLSRVFAGICGANLTAAQAYIADITSERERTAGMGLVGMAFGLGFALGPIVGIAGVWLTRLVDGEQMIHTGPGLLAAAICGLNFLWALRSLPESLPPERRGKLRMDGFASTRETLAALRHPIAGPLIVLSFLSMTAIAILHVCFALYAQNVLGMPYEGVYAYFIFIGAIMAVVQGWLVGKIVRFVSEQVLLLIGTGLLVIGLAVFPLFPHWGWLLLPLAILGVGQGVCQPSLMSLLSRGTDARIQGNVMGAAHAAQSLGRVLGPLFGGLFFDWGPRLPFWVAALIMTIALRWAFFTNQQLVKNGK